ncbi:hypothetical protein ACFL31_05005 [Candidatus Margulisiibacteriota bacterium]
MLKISALKEQDIPAIAEVENLSFAAPKDISVFKNDQHKYLVAKENNKIVGYIGVEKITGETQCPGLRRFGSYGPK